MKKIYTLMAATAVVFTANAQTRATHLATENHVSNRQITVHPTTPSTRALGDTLMWFPAPGVYCYDPADQAAFEIAFQDIDGLNPNNVGAPMDWVQYYSVNTDVNGLGNPTSDNYYHPYEDPFAVPDPDTAHFWAATSWFAPPGQADNWFMMGPVTIPATGTYNMMWYDRTNPAYRDGYKVFLSTTAVPGGLTFTDFTDPAIYTKTDAYPSPTYATDTTWVLRTAAIPAMYSGTVVYIAFQHNANDMDVLYLDDFTVASATSVGVNEFVNGVKVFQNMPNPFSAVSTIAYQLEKAASVSLAVYDVTGKKVAEQFEGTRSAGSHTIAFDGTDLSAGVYYYSLKVDENTSASMKMVLVK